MAALNKIIEWAKSELPAWQGDAVRRIRLSEMQVVSLALLGFLNVTATLETNMTRY